MSSVNISGKPKAHGSHARILVGAVIQPLYRNCLDTALLSTISTDLIWGLYQKPALFRKLPNERPGKGAKLQACGRRVWARKGLWKRKNRPVADLCIILTLAC